MRNDKALLKSCVLKLISLECIWPLQFSMGNLTSILLSITDMISDYEKFLS